MRIASITFLFILIALSTLANDCYWQQKVEYFMEVELIDSKHRLDGTSRIIYQNNSPDTLEKIFFHLYYNAFQPGSMMDVRSRTIKDPDRRPGDRISQLKSEEQGWVEVSNLRQDDFVINFETEGTILEGTLKEPLMPGMSTVITLNWQSQIPVQIRRTGRDNDEGIAYSMAQWYPKLCEYDQRGWHTNPYIAREFHGVWGDFYVNLILDEAYTIGASGYLQNANEIGKGYAPGKGKPKRGKLTWKFYAPNVHDFVWAADKSYIHDMVKVDDELTLHFFYQNDEEIIPSWKKLQSKAPEIFRFASEKFGKYPYKQYSIIQGGDGGMEYPMATLITGKRKERSLVGVTIHEAMHSWYQMVLATNEALYSWMDEGFTSYTETLVMDHIYPPKSEVINPHFRAYESYFNLIKAGFDEPLSTHADHYETNRAYWTSAYSKGEVFLKQLEYIIGRQNLEKVLLRYYNEWQFRHPTDLDFLRVAEKVSGLELDWYHQYFVNSTKTVDYAIAEIISNEGNTDIVLERLGSMMMPLDVVVTLKNGTQEMHHIPLRMMRGHKSEDFNGKIFTQKDWPWTHPGYVFQIGYGINEIESIEIDPSIRMADLERQNNKFTPPANSGFYWRSN